jgi:hypothetical protein
MSIDPEELPPPLMLIAVACCANCDSRIVGYQLDKKSMTGDVIDRCIRTWEHVKPCYVCKLFKERANE